MVYTSALFSAFLFKYNAKQQQATLAMVRQKQLWNIVITPEDRNSDICPDILCTDISMLVADFIKPSGCGAKTSKIET